MTKEEPDDIAQAPEPGTLEDLFPKREPSVDPAKDIKEKGEPDGGGEFA